MELADKGVRVNSVNPGVIITNVHNRAGYTEEQYSKFLEHCKTTHALGINLKYFHLLKFLNITNLQTLQMKPRKFFILNGVCTV